MNRPTYCRESGELIQTCQCSTCRLNRGEAVDLPSRVITPASRAGTLKTASPPPVARKENPMQCSCGASTKPGRAERSKQAAVLEFQECPICGHVHFDTLRVAGQIIATGVEAQRGFAAQEAGQPITPIATEPPRPEPPPPPAGVNFSFAF